MTTMKTRRPIHDRRRVVEAASGLTALLSESESTGRSPYEVSLDIIRRHCDGDGQGVLVLTAEYIIRRTKETGHDSRFLCDRWADLLLSELGRIVTKDGLLGSIKERLDGLVKNAADSELDQADPYVPEIWPCSHF